MLAGARTSLACGSLRGGCAALLGAGEPEGIGGPEAAAFGARSSHRLVRWLFLRLLGVVSCVAFASFASQARGLVGARGIQPVSETLRVLEQVHGSARFWRAPTLFWLDSGDATLLAVGWGGAVLSLLLVAGVAPRLVLGLLWLAYLSLCTVGGVFLGYQWDALLIEVLLAAILLAPGGWLERRPSAQSEPRALPFLLLRFVLFKLMLLSGVVKLTSGDPTWKNLTALQYHYWTQPLPSWTSAFVAGLPDLVHQLSVAATLVLEIGVPFLLWIPGRTRRLAVLATASFQLLILATGNFAFFNLLTLALCVLFLDDAILEPLLPRRWRVRGAPPSAAPGRRWRVALALLVGILLSLNVLVMLSRISRSSLPEPALVLLRSLAPWQSVNAYGLFAVMTTERPEIIVEGSDDGVRWQAYEFRHKPGALERRPRFVAPHQPRLDWQMWFAALRGCRRSPWFAGFAARLLEGSPAVLDLLGHDPFQGESPRYLRSRVYSYRFAPPETRRRTGQWWQREGPLGRYCPVFTLEGGVLRVASPG